MLYGKSYSKIVQNLSNQNVNVIIATVSLFRELHNWNRKNIENYCEIYIKTKITNIKNFKKKNYIIKIKQI